MAYVDETLVLTRAHLALEMAAIGRAMLEGDMEEARFLTHLLHSEAADLGLPEVASAAQVVLGYLPADHSPPRVGIGRAMLRLSQAMHAVA